MTTTLLKTAATTTTEATPRPKKTKPTVACWCGCGGQTKSRFVPGHDARFHSRAKQVARGTLDLNEQVALLPHDDARIEFAHHVSVERPKHAERVRLAEEAKAAQEAAKAAFAALAVVSENTEPQPPSVAAEETIEGVPAGELVPV